MADYYGLSKDGFKRKRLPEIKSDIFQRFEDATGVAVEKGSNSILGVLVGVIGYEIADMWKSLEDSYNAMYPNTAEGVSLSNSAGLAGILPRPATASIAVLTCYGKNGTYIPYGTEVSSSSDSNIVYSSVEDANISVDNFSVLNFEIDGEVASGKLYSININDVVVRYTANQGDSKSAVLIALATRLTSLTTGVTNDVLTISTDYINTARLLEYNGVRLTRLGSPIRFECETLGSIDTPVGTITQVIDTITGFHGAVNDVPVSVGNDADTDETLRQRWSASLYNRGSANIQAVRASVLECIGVNKAVVIENSGDVIDEDGLLPHSIEVIADGGNEEDIANAIFTKKSGGIQTNGTQVVEIRDSLTDKTYPIRFNRPTSKPIFVKVDVYDYTEEVWSSNNVNNIKQAVIDYGGQLSFGEDVIVQRFYGPIYSSTKGIGRIEVQMSTDGVSYSASNVPISIREVATFEFSNIEVVHHE